MNIEGSDEPEAQIRVLWLIKGLGPGGAERLLSTAARTHDRRGFAFEAAFLLPWKTALVADLEAVGVPVHCLEGSRLLDVRWAGALRQLLRDHRFDIVHIHSPAVAGIARPVIRTLPRSCRPRIVYTEHNVWPSYARGTRLVNAVTFALNDAMLAVSDDVYTSIPRALRTHSEVLVHGVRLDEIRAQRAHRTEMRAELGLRDDDVVIGTVANLRAEKAYPDLLEAARKVLAEEARACFVAVGQGQLEHELEAMHARLGLGDRFRFLGYRPDATRVMAAFDIFALASIYEGYPIAVMEALAVGLPVVATAVGGVPSAIRDGVEGHVVRPGHPDELAAALLELVRDPERRSAMSAAALVRSERYDITTAVRRIEDVYRSVLGR